MIDVGADGGEFLVADAVRSGRFGGEILAQGDHLPFIQICRHFVHGPLAATALEVGELFGDVLFVLRRQARIDGAGALAVSTVAVVAFVFHDLFRPFQVGGEKGGGG